MEPIRRMFTQEAFQDNNFGDGMFKGTAEKDDELIDQSDLSKRNRKFEKKQLNLFQRNIILEFRKQIRETKRSLDDFAVHTLEGFDDVVGNTLTPSSCVNACDQKEQTFDRKGTTSASDANGDQQDPDKIHRQYPSFDPVFMKV